MPVQRNVIMIDQQVTVVSPLVFNLATDNPGFVVTEDLGANAGRQLLADLDAERDDYRRHIFRILQRRNSAPVPNIVGTRLRISGFIETRPIAGLQILYISELQLWQVPALYRLLQQVTANNAAELMQYFDGGAQIAGDGNGDGSDDGDSSNDSDGDNDE